MEGIGAAGIARAANEKESSMTTRYRLTLLVFFSASLLFLSIARAADNRTYQEGIFRVSVPTTWTRMPPMKWTEFPVHAC